MKHFLSDAGFAGASAMVFALGNLALTIYVTRTASLSAFGEFSAAFAVVTLVEAIFIGRGGEIALQTVGKAWHQKDFALAKAYALRIGWSDLLVNTGLCAALGLFAWTLGPTLKLHSGYVAALALNLPVQSGYGIFKCLFVAQGAVKQQARFELLFSLVQVGSGFLLFTLYGIPGLIASYVLSAFVKTLAAYMLTRPMWPALPPGPPVVAPSMGAIGFQSLYRNSFSSLANQADIVILNAFRGPDAVALYKVAKSLATLPARVTGPVWAALRPRIMTAWHAGDRARVRQLIVWPALGLLAATVPVLGVLMLGAESLIALTFGAAYGRASAPFLIMLVGAWVFGSVTAWFLFWVIIAEQARTGVALYGVLALTTVVGGLAYGHQSVTHMAMATCAAALITSLLAWLAFLRALNKLTPEPAR